MVLGQGELRVVLHHRAETGIGGIVHDQDAHAAGPDPWLDHGDAELVDTGGELLERVGGARGHHRQPAVQPDQVGLVDVPGEHLGAVEQPGPAATRRAQATNSSCRSM